MKNIIQSIFGAKDAKKSNNPSAWLNQLEEMDDIAALQFSTNQLSQTLNRTDGEEILGLKQQLELIIQVEALNHLNLERLASQFSKVESLKTELANSISESCYNYCRQSYICHLKVIEKIFSSKNKSENAFNVDDKIACLIIARALQAAFNMVKWRLFTQASPPTSVWLQIFMLFRIASQKSFLNNSLEVFATAPRTTIAAHFVQVWMLGQLSQASLQKLHIEIASRILNALLTRALISTKHTPEQYTFYVDFEKDASGKRMRNFEPNEHCRYWETDDLEKHLRVALTVSERGEIPQSLALSKIDNAKKLNETASILIGEWQKSGYVRQRRISTRHASSKNARVNAGITDICKQVQQTNLVGKGLNLARDGKSLEERIRAHTTLRQSSGLSPSSATLDNWTITDESEHGLGARVNKFSSLLVRPDKLIGLVMDDDPSNIIIGVIRSTKPTQSDKLRVGIEIVSRYPKWVQLQPLMQDEIFPNTKTDIDTISNIYANNSALDVGLFSGIYLPIEAGMSESSALILSKLDFRPNTNYMVKIEGAEKHVMLGQPIESRDDWVKVAFPF